MLILLTLVNNPGCSFWAATHSPMWSNSSQRPSNMSRSDSNRLRILPRSWDKPLWRTWRTWPAGSRRPGQSSRGPGGRAVSGGSPLCPSRRTKSTRTTMRITIRNLKEANLLSNKMQEGRPHSTQGLGTAYKAALILETRDEILLSLSPIPAQ